MKLLAETKNLTMPPVGHRTNNCNPTWKQQMQGKPCQTEEDLGQVQNEDPQGSSPQSRKSLGSIDSL